MIFQDISKHNKKPITLVSNLFANLNGISDRFDVFWPEVRLQLHMNGFAETYAAKLGSTLLVRKTHATFCMQLKQYQITLLETQQFGWMLDLTCLGKKTGMLQLSCGCFINESLTPWKFWQAIQHYAIFFVGLQVPQYCHTIVVWYWYTRALMELKGY